MRGFSSLDALNHANLTALWRALGAADPPELPGGSLSLRWPDRVWFEVGYMPLPQDLERIEALRGERSLMLPLWGEPDPALEAFGYTGAFQQTAMSLDLATTGVQPRSSDRIVTLEDTSLLGAWIETASRAFGYPIDPEVFAPLFEDPGATFYADVRSGGEIAGTGLVYDDGQAAGVHQVGVSPEHRRQGVARSIMDTILHDLFAAHEAGESTGLVTLQASDQGLGLYESLGFTGTTVIQNHRSRGTVRGRR